MSDTITTAPTPDDLLHESKITPVQLGILALCYIAYILDGFDVVIISYTAPAISAEWGLAADQLGLVFSAGVLGMTLGAMFLSSLSDLYGRRLVATVMLLLAGVATYAAIYAITVTQLIVLRLIAGLGLGALMATLAPWCSEFSPKRYRTLILAILFSGGAMGPVLGGIIAAPLISEYGWRPIFQYAGLLTILVAALVYLVVPESMAFLIQRKPDSALPKINRILRYIGQEPIEQLPQASLATVRESATVLSLLTPARWARTLVIWTTFFLAFLTVYFLTSWVPQALVSVGFSQGQAIQGTVLIPLGSVLGTLLFGWLARWYSLSRIIAVVFVIGALCISLLTPLLKGYDGGSFALIWVLLFLVGVTLMGAYTSLYTVALTMYPAQVRSTGLGWAAGLGRGGAVISPTLAGFLLVLGVPMSSLFLYFAVPALLAALGAIFVSDREMA